MLQKMRLQMPQRKEKMTINMRIFDMKKIRLGVAALAVLLLGVAAPATALADAGESVATVEATVNGTYVINSYIAVEFGNAMEFAENHPGAVLTMLKSSDGEWEGKEINDPNADFTFNLNGNVCEKTLGFSGGKVTIKDSNTGGRLEGVEINGSGTVNLENAAITSVNVDGGTFNANGGAIENITITNGQLNWNSSAASVTGTITDKGSGKITINQAPQSKLQVVVASEKLGEHIYSCNVDNTDSINLTTYLPEGYGTITNATVTKETQSGTVTYVTEPAVDISTGVLTYTIGQNSNVGKGMIKAVLSTANNIDITVLISIETKNLGSGGSNSGSGSSDSVSEGATVTTESEKTIEQDVWKNTIVTEEAAPIAVPYMVKKGDCMKKIAREHGITLEQLIALNPQVKNPNLIYVGQVLIISNTGATVTTTTTDATKTYTVQRGDSLYKIAKKNGLPLAELKVLNANLFAQKYIYAGQTVLLK